MIFIAEYANILCISLLTAVLFEYPDFRIHADMSEYEVKN